MPLEIIFVAMNDYRTACTTNILTSGGLGPCIALGMLYGSKHHYGRMAHCPQPAVVLEPLNQFLQDAQKLKKHYANLRLYLAGGCSHGDTAEYYAEGLDAATARTYVLERLAASDLLAALRKNWMCADHHCTSDHASELVLDLPDGTASLRKRTKLR